MSAGDNGMRAPARPWHDTLLDRLRAHHVVIQHSSRARLAPAFQVRLAPEGWAKAGSEAADMGFRCAALWGDDDEQGLTVRALLELEGDYLVLSTTVPASTPELASLTPCFPYLSRMERHARDMFGLRFEGHPDARRWTRHRAWHDDEFPLRREFAWAPHTQPRTPADTDYPFARVEGAGVHEIPVGPVHAGIIEPGHFRFQAVGEDILRLEARLGYVHKGIERRAAGMDADTLIQLAGRVSGDTTVAHAWAACQALERGQGWESPPRALALRALLAERERVANHLGDIGAIANDVGFAFANYQFSRLREHWQRTNARLFGHRLLMDCLVPGGVASDLPPDAIDLLALEHRQLRDEVAGLFDILTDHPPLDDRLLTTGRLAGDDARALGTLGYVGRASGQTFDVRRDNPYAPYDQYAVHVPVLHEGDVAARMQVRMAELEASLDLMDRVIADVPTGPHRADLPMPVEAEGLGCVEGWRGEITTYLRLDDAGRVARFFPRDPSWFNWLALERLIDGNLVPDFPVCNKSVNGSYSGHDL